ncbi:TetR/AcrR family transcriptional regulator [Nocardioides litoris]|uniref:TetR/AcrR family transcriptional regulator n=1 Tax=Nocardioides litoris TaxID=1926648 RepID=UPI0011235EDE|nr:TetR/AcrR family transcriptional regulator [Nocardioides litoris]
MPAPRDDAILDAARHVFEQYGARRATVDDVAATAGVSRSTLYRSYPGKEALLAAVVQRETDTFFDELDEVAAGLPPRQALVECFVRGISLLRQVPVLGRLAVTEPAVVTGTPGHPPLLRRHTDRVAATLRRAGAALPDAELEQAAEILVRLASTYLVDPEGSLDLADPAAVGAWADRWLVPLLP